MIYCTRCPKRVEDDRFKNCADCRAKKTRIEFARRTDIELSKTQYQIKCPCGTVCWYPRKSGARRKNLCRPCERLYKQQANKRKRKHRNRNRPARKLHPARMLQCRCGIQYNVKAGVRVSDKCPECRYVQRNIRNAIGEACMKKRVSALPLLLLKCATTGCWNKIQFRVSFHHYRFGLGKPVYCSLCKLKRHKMSNCSLPCPKYTPQELPATHRAKKRKHTSMQKAA